MGCSRAYITCKKVEARAVELVGPCEIRRAHPEVAELVDRRRTLREPLRLAGSSVLVCRLYAMEKHGSQSLAHSLIHSFTYAFLYSIRTSKGWIWALYVLD